MSLFEKRWTASRADDWTIHDLIASVLSLASYVLTVLGTAGALLLQVWGYVALGAGIISIVLMWLVIDPKLKAMSEAFAGRQQEYLEHVEKTTRWER